MALRPLTQGDFSGGINAVANPFIITKKQVWRMRNFILDEHGSLRTRPGFGVLTTSPDTANPIVTRGKLIRVDGTTFSFAIQREIASGLNRLYHTDPLPWTSIGTFAENFITPDVVYMSDVAVIASGYVTPATWDGTTFGNITSGAGQTTPPGARHMAFHLGSLWLWNTNAATTTLDGKSSIRQSASNDFDDWPNANQSFISKDDSQEGMGLGTYTITEAGISPTQTLVAFKNRSSYQITGVFGASTFSIQQLKSDMGCVAPRSIQFVSGFGLIRLSHKGFALYNGIDDRLLSEEVRPFIFGRDDIVGLDDDNLDVCWASQSQDPPLYICVCPIAGAGTVLNRMFVYDLVRKAWAICDFPVNIQCLALIPGSHPEVHAGTESGGTLIRIFGPDVDDNGSDIDWDVRFAPKYMGSFMRPTYWRRAVFDLLVTVDDQHVTATATFLGLTGTLQRIFSFSGFGTTRWGGIDTGDIRRSFSLQRTAPAVYIDLAGQGNVKIRGIEYQGVPQPLTRVSNQ